MNIDFSLILIPSEHHSERRVNDSVPYGYTPAFYETQNSPALDVVQTSRLHALNQIHAVHSSKLAMQFQPLY